MLRPKSMAAACAESQALDLWKIMVPLMIFAAGAVLKVIDDWRERWRRRSNARKVLVAFLDDASEWIARVKVDLENPDRSSLDAAAHVHAYYFEPEVFVRYLDLLEQLPGGSVAAVQRALAVLSFAHATAARYLHERETDAASVPATGFLFAALCTNALQKTESARAAIGANS